jgi:hypothetical protein
LKFLIYFLFVLFKISDGANSVIDFRAVDMALVVSSDTRNVNDGNIQWFKDKMGIDPKYQSERIGI